MIDYDAMRDALRTRALTLEVATTGSTSLSATATGYARAAGSFLADGFRDGMELEAAGFGEADNNGTKVITAVSATTLSCAGCIVEAADAGRSLTVGFPAGRAWENEEFEPTPGSPYVQESFAGGPSQIPGVVPHGWIDVTPLYVLQFFVPANSGASALDRYVDACMKHLASGTGIGLPGGDTLRVRSNPGPFRGSILYPKPGWAMVSVTVPLRLFTLATTTN